MRHRRIITVAAAAGVVALLTMGATDCQAPAGQAGHVGSEHPAKHPAKQPGKVRHHHVGGGPQKTVTGRGWARRAAYDCPYTDLVEQDRHCNMIITYQLDLSAGRRTLVDQHVSRAVYEACGLGERYPRCAAGAR